MADKNIQMTQRNSANTGWDNLFPKSKAGNVTVNTISGLSGNDVQTCLQNLFTFASDGKSSIATAITGMGQSASSSDSFATLATKIGNISNDANASTSHVLSGKTFYQGGIKRTGTMGNYTSGYNTDSLTKSGNTLRMSIPNSGYYSDSAYIQYTDNDWVESNIRKGVNVFGKTGTLSTSSIKNIQNGTYIVHSAASPQSTDISISTVNTNCAIVVVNFRMYDSGPYSSNTVQSHTNCSAELTSSTNLHVETSMGGNAYGIVEYKIIEFQNDAVASFQKGVNNISGSASGSNPQFIPITAINPNQSLLVYSSKIYSYSSTNEVRDSTRVAYLYDSNNIAVVQPYSVDWYWTVIEFNL